MHLGKAANCQKVLRPVRLPAGILDGGDRHRLPCTEPQRGGLDVARFELEHVGRLSVDALHVVLDVAALGGPDRLLDRLRARLLVLLLEVRRVGVRGERARVGLDSLLPVAGSGRRVSVLGVVDLRRLLHRRRGGEEQTGPE